MSLFKKSIVSLLASLLSLGSFAQKPFAIKATNFKKDTFNIVQFGAKPDGLSLNTVSINKAIQTCSAKGGGVVLVPKGFWMTGPIELKSNVNLSIDRSAVLQFTADFNQYALQEGNWEGIPSVRNQSPISATNAENIAITGSGIIDGNGDAWRMVKKDKLNESQWKKLIAKGGMLSEDKKTWYPSEKSFRGSQNKNANKYKSGQSLKDFEDIKDFLRPNLVVLSKCKKVLLEGVTFQNSPAWCLHPLMCEDLMVKSVYAKNPWYAQNGDGIDIESCKNFLVENSTFDVGDDGICIKSGKDEEGRKRAMPTENGIIRHCIVYHAHGGFVIGSEMSGGAKNLYVSDCSFIGTDIGLRFKTTRGRGGVVEKIYIKDINMKDIVAEAILFDMYYMAKDPVQLVGEKREVPKVELLPVDEGTPQFKDFHVSNIVCNGAEKAIFIRGLPEMHIKDIELNNLTIQSNVGVIIEEASDITINHLQLITKETNPTVAINNSNHVSFDYFQNQPDAETLVSVAGSKTDNIVFKHTDTSKAKKKVETADGLSDKVITFE